MRIASPQPSRCSACFGQKIGQPHVDFESVWEGPLLDPEQPRGGHIDWLAICEDCLFNALSLLPERADRSRALEERIAYLEGRLASEGVVVEGLRTALAAVEARVEPEPFEVPAVREVERPAEAVERIRPPVTAAKRRPRVIS